MPPRAARFAAATLLCSAHGASRAVVGLATLTSSFPPPRPLRLPACRVQPSVPILADVANEPLAVFGAAAALSPTAPEGPDAPGGADSQATATTEDTTAIAPPPALYGGREIDLSALPIPVALTVTAAAAACRDHARVHVGGPALGALVGAAASEPPKGGWESDSDGAAKRSKRRPAAPDCGGIIAASHTHRAVVVAAAEAAADAVAVARAAAGCAAAAAALRCDVVAVGGASVRGFAGGAVVGNARAVDRRAARGGPAAAAAAAKDSRTKEPQLDSGAADGDGDDEPDSSAIANGGAVAAAAVAAACEARAQDGPMRLRVAALLGLTNDVVNGPPADPTATKPSKDGMLSADSLGMLQAVAVGLLAATRRCPCGPWGCDESGSDGDDDGLAPATLAAASTAPRMRRAASHLATTATRMFRVVAECEQAARAVCDAAVLRSTTLAASLWPCGRDVAGALGLVPAPDGPADAAASKAAIAAAATVTGAAAKRARDAATTAARAVAARQPKTADKAAAAEAAAVAGDSAAAAVPQPANTAARLWAHRGGPLRGEAPRPIASAVGAKLLQGGMRICRVYNCANVPPHGEGAVPLSAPSTAAAPAAVVTKGPVDPRADYVVVLPPRPPRAPVVLALAPPFAFRKAAAVAADPLPFPAMSTGAALSRLLRAQHSCSVLSRIAVALATPTAAAVVGSAAALAPSDALLIAAGVALPRAYGAGGLRLADRWAALGEVGPNSPAARLAAMLTLGTRAPGAARARGTSKAAARGRDEFNDGDMVALGAAATAWRGRGGEGEGAETTAAAVHHAVACVLGPWWDGGERGTRAEANERSGGAGGDGGGSGARGVGPHGAGGADADGDDGTRGPTGVFVPSVDDIVAAVTATYDDPRGGVVSQYADDRSGDVGGATAPSRARLPGDEDVLAAAALVATRAERLACGFAGVYAAISDSRSCRCTLASGAIAHVVERGACAAADCVKRATAAANAAAAAAADAAATATRDPNAAGPSSTPGAVPLAPGTHPRVLMSNAAAVESAPALARPLARAVAALEAVIVALREALRDALLRWWREGGAQRMVSTARLAGAAAAAAAVAAATTSVSLQPPAPPRVKEGEEPPPPPVAPLAVIPTPLVMCGVPVEETQQLRLRRVRLEVDQPALQAALGAECGLGVVCQRVTKDGACDIAAVVDVLRDMGSPVAEDGDSKAKATLHAAACAVLLCTQREAAVGVRVNQAAPAAPVAAVTAPAAVAAATAVATAALAAATTAVGGKAPAAAPKDPKAKTAPPSGPPALVLPAAPPPPPEGADAAAKAKYSDAVRDYDTAMLTYVSNAAVVTAVAASFATKGAEVAAAVGAAPPEGSGAEPLEPAASEGGSRQEASGPTIRLVSDVPVHFKAPDDAKGSADGDPIKGHHPDAVSCCGASRGARCSHPTAADVVVVADVVKGTFIDIAVVLPSASVGSLSAAASGLRVPGGSAAAAAAVGRAISSWGTDISPPLGGLACGAFVVGVPTFGDEAARFQTTLCDPVLAPQPLAGALYEGTFGTAARSSGDTAVAYAGSAGYAAAALAGGPPRQYVGGYGPHPVVPTPTPKCVRKLDARLEKRIVGYASAAMEASACRAAAPFSTLHAQVSARGVRGGRQTTPALTSGWVAAAGAAAAAPSIPPSADAPPPPPPPKGRPAPPTNTAPPWAGAMPLAGTAVAVPLAWPRVATAAAGEPGGLMGTGLLNVEAFGGGDSVGGVGGTGAFAADGRAAPRMPKVPLTIAGIAQLPCVRGDVRVPLGPFVEVSLTMDVSDPVYVPSATAVAAATAAAVAQQVYTDATTLPQTDAPVADPAPIPSPPHGPAAVVESVYNAALGELQGLLDRYKVLLLHVSRLEAQSGAASGRAAALTSAILQAATNVPIDGLAGCGRGTSAAASAASATAMAAVRRALLVSSGRAPAIVHDGSASLQWHSDAGSPGVEGDRLVSSASNPFAPTAFLSSPFGHTLHRPFIARRDNPALLVSSAAKAAATAAAAHEALLDAPRAAAAAAKARMDDLTVPRRDAAAVMGLVGSRFGTASTAHEQALPALTHPSTFGAAVSSAMPVGTQRQDANGTDSALYNAGDVAAQRAALLALALGRVKPA